MRRSVGNRVWTIAAAVAIAGHAALLFGQQTTTITVHEGALQPFGGFGLHPGDAIKPAYRDTINKFLINGLNITTGRFYVGFNTVISSQWNSDSILNNFDQHYKHAEGGSILSDWLKINPNLVMVLSNATTIDSVHKYQPFVNAWSEAIKRFATERNLHFSFVDVTSEPNVEATTSPPVPAGTQTCWMVYGDSVRFCHGQRRSPPETYAQLVKLERAALDAQGLDTVKLMVPEVSSCDDIGKTYLNNVMNDPDAKKCVGAMMAKSYNMLVDMDFADAAWNLQVPFLTAAGANLIDWVNNEHSADNDSWAAEMVGRMFSDFNHMVTHWLWYFGITDYTTREAAHRLTWVFPDQASVSAAGLNPADCMVLGPDCYLLVTLKYYYMQQLSRNFDIGARFRYCTQDPKEPWEDMLSTYGQKPSVAATAAVNPGDGSWTIGLVNLTGCVSDTRAITATHPKPDFTFYPASPYTVTVTVEELADWDTLRFAVYRSSKTKKVALEDSVTMENGSVEVILQPKELVTLRGAAGTGETAAVDRAVTKPADVREPYVRSDGALAIPHAAVPGLRVRIVNAAGRIVRSLTTGPSHTRVLVVPREALPAGVYFVRLENGTLAKTTRVVR